MKDSFDPEEIDDIPDDAEDLDATELSGSDNESSLDVTEDDEDEDEGVGDGNIGRQTPDPLSK